MDIQINFFLNSLSNIYSTTVELVNISKYYKLKRSIKYQKCEFRMLPILIL